MPMPDVARALLRTYRPLIAIHLRNRPTPDGRLRDKQN